MSATSLLAGALRTQLRISRPPTHSCFPLRTISTASLARALSLRPHLPHRSQQSPILSLVSSRSFSLSSLFTQRKPVTPTPETITEINTLEAEANASQHDISKQTALFAALAATDTKSGYEIIINRWERMCEHDPTSPLLRSDEAFTHYLSALQHTGQVASFQPACRRRDSLLASVGTAATSTSTESSSTVTDSSDTPVDALASNPSSNAQPVTASSPPPAAQTASQAVANAVLGSRLATPSPNLENEIAAAINAGRGVPGNPIVVELSEKKGSWVPGIIRFSVLTLVSVFLLLIVFSVLMDNSGLIKAGPRQMEFEPAQGKTYKFSDVHGVDEVKDELQEVVMFLKDPTNFTTLGGKLPKGILLTGPPGTGKTLLARAVAGEAGVPFLFASGSEFDEMFVGVGAKRMRELFAAARKKQPAIIFIDELDAVGGKRSQRESQYMRQTLNQLLVEMDGFLQNEGIIVIGATNFPESLDQALIRPGRFDRHIAVPLPDVRGRTQILKHHMQNVVSAPEADVMVLARGTPGFSGADLQNMVNMAAVQASREGATAVGLKHFEWAKDRILMGAERKSAYISDHVKKLTAYHEGGHALVSLFTDGAMPLHKVTCIPRGHALGYTSQLPLDDRYSRSFKEFLADIDVAMGGRVAEELVYGPENVTSGASSDLEHATRVARALVKRYGFSEKIGPVAFTDRDEAISPQKLDEIEAEVRGLLKDGESRVETLLKEKELELHRVRSSHMDHDLLRC
ncbi:P-loop containing nucleoside triphosphate hydrolase protein [Irpex rosettiformis]|uniref:P-loop containing nucleoside triphosphate hydrolase protein n=1 Tax=Irpex rosettiformis TaxID=378272 RepID=A0ACB8UH86_9APHY|nr:P-loop containing nucleoside triphosphate hydrolase protein [Irpex rosettiformis]